jgi:hypothetical protein
LYGGKNRRRHHAHSKNIRADLLLFEHLFVIRQPLLHYLRLHTKVVLWLVVGRRVKLIMARLWWSSARSIVLSEKKAIKDASVEKPKPMGPPKLMSCRVLNAVGQETKEVPEGATIDYYVNFEDSSIKCLPVGELLQSYPTLLDQVT